MTPTVDLPLSVRSTASAGRAGVRQQRHLAGVLDRGGDEALLLDGHPGHPARADLAAVGDELAQQRGVLVVDVLDLGDLERVRLLLGLTHNGLGHRGCSPCSTNVEKVRSEGGLVVARGVVAPATTLGTLVAGRLAPPAT